MFSSTGVGQGKGLPAQAAAASAQHIASFLSSTYPTTDLTVLRESWMAADTTQLIFTAHPQKIKSEVQAQDLGFASSF